jgi:hypothetical protein
MTTYPAIIPSSRDFGPGKYPHSIFRALSGTETSVRHSSAMVESPVELRYSVLDEAEMIQILDHYNLVKGGFLPFAVPNIVWSGNENPNDFTIIGNAWRYSQPPEVEEVFCGGGTGNSGAGYVVTVVLESIPGEGAGILGPQFRARTVFTPGKPATTNGPQFVVKTSLEFGLGFAPGFTATATTTFTPGTATGGTTKTVEGGIFFARAKFRPGFALDGTARLFTAKSIFTPAQAISSGALDFSKVAILIHGWNGFKDDSFNDTQLTVNEDVVATNTDPRFGSQSIAVPTGNSNQHIRWANIILARPWTIEMWVWMDNFDSTNFVFSQNPFGNQNIDSNLRVNINRSIVIQVANSDGDFLQTDAGVIQPSTWHHVAATVDETTLRLFVDGDLKASRARPSNLAYTFTLGQIGPRTIRFQEFRATNQCLYTEAFTRPLQTFPSLAGITHATVDGPAFTAATTFTPGTASGG